MFESAFSDTRNVESFKQLVSALILAEIQWTVSELARGISRPDEERNPAGPTTILSVVSLCATKILLEKGGGAEAFSHPVLPDF